ncbi:MAG: glycosyltransferase [Candidatus Bathyarchaeia archaeon]
MSNADHALKVLVTIGLCVKNSEGLIEQSIESIINQDYPLNLIQLIVVDGSSKDKILSIIRRIISKTNLKLEIYYDEGKGLGTARQLVFNNAKGNYIIFVDADMRLFRDFVRNHVKFMEEHPDLGAAFGRPMLQEGTLVATVLDLAAYTVGGGVGAGSSICRIEALRQVGGFDLKIRGAAEDRDLFARIRLHGWNVSINESAKYFHRHRESLGSFWVEQSWFGYGDHYFNHKHSSISDIGSKHATGGLGKSLTSELFLCSVGTVWHKLPVGEFVWGLKLASKAYKLTSKHTSFLILPLLILGNLGWWRGFAKAHRDGYGHKK